MRIPRVPHSWSLTPRQAIAVQREMASSVSQVKPTGALRFIAGLDAAFSSDGCWCLSAVVLWDALGQRLVEQHTARRRLRFPYIPGLLSFREVPALLAALRQLRHTPDLLMCDGQGLAHPRRFGIACHVGVICELPAVGCAKSRLIGEHEQPASKRGSRAPLLDRGEVIGTVLRTQTGVKPVYVSIGHRIDRTSALEIVLTCATKYRLPEPTRLADQWVAAAKRASTASPEPAGQR
ncbi:MAG: deoxyribonuclease V [Verrucomicrobia bacterium]|nr:deoxyribonuclease V [Verrucomicrobiota bacterium]